MLPGSGVRRRREDTVKDGMNRLSSTMNDSARRYRRLPVAGKIVFCLSSLFSLLMYGFVLHYFAQHDIKDDKFLDVPTCPACFGSSGCGLVYYDQVKLTGWSGYRLQDIFSTKNIRYATLSGNMAVVLKKLGSEAEIEELDDKVCTSANRPTGCDVSKVLFVTDVSVSLRKEALQPKHLTQTAGMFTCASYRLMDRMWSHYKERRKQKDIKLGDKLQVWYTATLNPEPLLLQTFPASERWPFPEYFGACGRHVIVQHVGRTLQEYRYEPFHTRAGIAYELLRMASHLTDNQEDFALYITDPSWDNFGVDASGKVRILDAENIIVVDKLAIEAKKQRDYETFLQSEHRMCSGDSTCLSMVPDNLCTHLHSDHNYYAICTNLLDPRIDDGVMPGGLLHDMPEEAKDFWDLEHHLNECVRPSKYKGRIAAKEQLLTALLRLHDRSAEHLDPPPKIDKKGVPPPVQPKKELWEYDDYDDAVVDGKASDLEAEDKGQGQAVMEEGEELRKGGVVFD